MEYHLENKVFINMEPKGLYPWSLQEFDKENKQIRTDMIPWEWSLCFTASELCHNLKIEICKSEKLSSNKKIQQTPTSEYISGILHSGICNNGEYLENEVLYSLFGTNRIIKHFRLTITRVEDPHFAGSCQMSGIASFNLEVDFRDQTADDDICVDFFLAADQFDKIAALINSKYVDRMVIRLKNVPGFYSEWSPSVSTSNIKILVEDTKVITEGDCNIYPPRLGDVSDFKMEFTQRHLLNIKQDLRAINIDKLFENSEDDEEYELHESQKTQNSPLSHLAKIEVALKKFRLPIWLIFSILCILLIK